MTNIIYRTIKYITPKSTIIKNKLFSKNELIAINLSIKKMKDKNKK